MRRLTVFLLAALLLAGLFAAPALARELYVVVERTAAVGERVPLTIRAGAAGRALVRAWRIADPGALLDRGVSLDRGETLGFLDPLQVKATPAQRALRQAARLRPVLTGTPFQVPAGRAHEIDLDLGEPGLFLIGVTQNGQTAYATALVSDLGLVVKRSAGRLLAWTVRRASGRPWPDVVVSASLETGGRITAQSDADGVVAFEKSIATVADVRATVGRHLALGVSEWYAASAADRRVYLYTHQPAYRPGERVEVKGIVRRADGTRLTLDRGIRTTQVKLIDATQAEAATVQVPVSQGMGTFQAGFDLAKDAKTGTWRIVAVMGEREYESTLQVSAYRKPAFEVSVQAAARRVMVGGPTSFAISAGYYDGGVLSNAPVTWQVMAHRVDRELFPEDELVRLFFGTEREAYRPETLATGTGRLDALGRLEVPVEVPADRPDGYLSLRATVTGPDRMAVAGSGRVAVSSAPVAVAVQTDRHLYGPEDVARVTVRAERADGTPAVGREGLLTVGLVAAAPGGGEAVEERWLHTLPFTTGPEGVVALQAPLAGVGRYTIAVSLPRAAAEAEGPPAHAAVHVWAAGGRSTPGATGVGLEVVADRDSYAVGDEARLLVVPGGGARPVLATLERESVMGRTVLKPGEVAPIWSVQVGDEHVPNVFVTFAAVQQGRLITSTRMLRVPPRTRVLRTEVIPDAAEVEPGASSGLTLRVSDDQGRPVEGAEVGVAIVDEALLALHADPAAPIEAFFHPPVRNAVGTVDLLDWRSVGWAALPVEEAKNAAGAVESEAPAADPSAMPAPSSPVPEPSPRPEAVEEPADGRPEAPAEESTGDDGGEVLEDAEEESRAEGAAHFASAKKAKGRRTNAARVREDFRSAILWEPALRTGPEGRVRLDEVRYGDSLTRWRIGARSVDASSRVGSGSATVRTRRKVAAQVTLPRFLRAGDVATLPLVLRNLTDEGLEAAWTLLAKAADGWERRGTATLAAHGTQTSEQTFASTRPGTVTFEALVSTKAGGDAERRQLEVLPQGIRKVTGTTLVARNGTSEAILAIPKHAVAGTIEAVVSVEPAYADACLTALPYLLEYPYGCTEQTLNRFVPLLAAAEALEALGRRREGLAARMPEMIDAGLKRLAALQHTDGGFGWWEQDASDPGMTALVVRGLSRLVAVRPEDKQALRMRGRAVQALEKLGPQSDPTLQASVDLALAAAGKMPADRLTGTRPVPWRDLPPLAQALCLRAAVATGQTEIAAGLRGHLDDVAVRTDDTMHWAPRNAEARWQDDPVETTATVLLALLEAGVRPEVLDGGARWLLEARRGGDRWQSTRDTAAAVEFFAALARSTGDLGAGKSVSVDLNGETIFSAELTKESAGAPIGGALSPAVLTPGSTLALALTCPKGAVTAAIAIRYHETGPAITASEHGFKVSRRFFRLTPTKREGEVVWARQPVTETLPAGTLLECEVTVETARPREYVMVTSPHAGTFEPVRETGMAVPGRVAAAHARTEGYDDRTMFFVTRLAAGRSVFRHTVRVTHVGSFTTLPAQCELMYFPDVRGNSNGEGWQVTPAGPVGVNRR